MCIPASSLLIRRAGAEAAMLASSSVPGFAVQRFRSSVRSQLIPSRRKMQGGFEGRALQVAEGTPSAKAPTGPANRPTIAGLQVDLLVRRVRVGQGPQWSEEHDNLVTVAGPTGRSGANRLVHDEAHRRRHNRCRNLTIKIIRCHIRHRCWSRPMVWTSVDPLVILPL
jgi:hypothetical protein